ncbi:MAG: hypothetical protein V3575_05450 [Candidatus Absconditabacteria bacterium]
MKDKLPNINSSIKTTKLKRKTSKVTLIKKIESDQIMLALISLSKGNPLQEDKDEPTILQ